MATVAPKTRKHLSAEALFHLVRHGFATIPDARGDDVDMTLPAALLSAFTMFSLKAPALLAFDQERAEGNLHTIYGIERVPCDTHMRAILAPISPKGLRPVCKRLLRPLQRGKVLETMTFLESHYLLALDGTEYFSSTTIHCASCVRRGHRNGSITYAHQMLGAALIHPDQRAVIPLMPEPIGTLDGMEKNACERKAAKRLVTKLRQEHPHLKCIITVDSLSAHAPHIETLHAHGLPYILGVKEGDHPYRFQQVQAAEHADRVTWYERHARALGVVQRFRFVHDLPLNASHPDVRIHFIAYWEIGATQVQHWSWVTAIRVRKRHVYQLMRGGRARWKIETETFKTLKTQGDHFKHNYGPGEQHLSVVFAMLMLLAFLVDHAQQLCCALFQAVWAKLGSKRLVLERRRALFSPYALASIRQLLEALFYGLQKPPPVLSLDAT